MKMVGNRLWKKVVSKSLIWLGFGATPFVFMACYGPVPSNYQEADFTEEEVVDSLQAAEDTMAVEMAAAVEDVAESESAE